MAVGTLEAKPSKISEQVENKNLQPSLVSRGMAAAIRFLERRGYEVLEREWKCPFGQADVIAKTESGDAVVFVRVATRAGADGGFPPELGARERGRWESIAACYVASRDLGDGVSVRFDVVSMLVVGEDRALLKHHINAFGDEPGAAAPETRDVGPEEAGLGASAAAAHFEEEGYEVLEKGLPCGMSDGMVVASGEGGLVFARLLVEPFDDSRDGEGPSAPTSEERRCMESAAAAYLASHAAELPNNVSVRFDTVTVYLDMDKRVGRLVHSANALA